MDKILLPAIEVPPAKLAQASIIWLHGLGADGHDFAGIAPQLALDHAARFIFPHAPLRPVTINGGYVMRAWYDVKGLDKSAPEDLAGIQASSQAINAWIEHEHTRGIPYHKIILAGFSQGGAIALYAGLRHPQRLGGILALSSYLPQAAVTAQETQGRHRDLPIFIGHGTEDTVVALTWGELSHQHLQSIGYQPEWHTYPMPHSVHPDEISDIAKWLNGIIIH